MTVLIQSQRKSDKPILGSIFARLMFVAIAGFNFIAVALFLIIDSITGTGIDESVPAFFRLGVVGTAFGDFYTEMVLGALYLIAVSTLCIWLYDNLGWRRWGFNKNLKPLFKFKWKTKPKIFAFGFLCAAVLVNPFLQDIGRLYAGQTNSALTRTEAKFYQPLESLPVLSGKNLVVIYAEGLERSFMDTDVFPDLLPNLSALEARSVSFSDIRQTYFTGFTIGGMVASQCGVPIYTPAHRNAMNNYDQFMGNTKCLGDVLKANNYTSHFIGGADIRFSGKGNFYKTHGFDKVLGSIQLLNSQRIIRENFSRWGASDDILLEQAKKEFEALSTQDNPFALFVLTLDTHPPNGHVSKSCMDKKYGDGSVAILNAVHCADRQISDFVKVLQKSEVAKDTIIVVMSDHLMMRSPASEFLAQTQRRNVFMIIDPSQEDAMQISRPATLLDIGPTLIAYMGGDVTTMGFGRNLWQASNMTLIEKFKQETKSVLQKYETHLQSRLWNFPALGETLKIVKKGRRQKLVLGERELELPLILKLGIKNQITDIEFDSPYTQQKSRYLKSRIPETGVFMWIDSCQIIRDWEAGREKSEVSDERYCLMSGNITDLDKLKLTQLNWDDPYVVANVLP